MITTAEIVHPTVIIHSPRTDILSVSLQMNDKFCAVSNPENMFQFTSVVYIKYITFDIV